MDKIPEPDRLLDAGKVAEKLSCSMRAVAKLAQAEHFPRRVQIGARMARWSEREIDRWLEGQKAAAKAV